MKFLTSLSASIAITLTLGSGSVLGQDTANDVQKSDQTPEQVPEMSLTQQALLMLAQKQNAQALATLEQAVAQGEGEAGFYLGRMIELGAVGRPNVHAAVPYYVRAAEMDSANAIHRLGMLQFEGGGGLLQNYEKAQELLCRSADLGHVQAMFNCAQLYASEQAMQDSEQALAYFNRAIDAGYTPAMVSLAVIYDRGELVERDVEAGHALLARAADLGDPVGLFHMAVASERGQFVEADNIAAHMYYNLASSRGHNDARAEMIRLASDMTPQDVKAAQAAAVNWLADHAAPAEK